MILVYGRLPLVAKGTGLYPLAPTRRLPRGQLSLSLVAPAPVRANAANEA